MIILDCESFQTALESSAEILCIDPIVLLDSLRGFEYDKVPEVEQRQRPYDNLLIRHAVGIDPLSLLTPKGIYWFHATRVPPATTFQEGILPLSARLENLWSLLGQLATGWVTQAEWEYFRMNMRGHGAERYKLKLSHGVISEGPFAFLVRDAILRPNEISSHDYLDIPEIVEDICLSFEEMYARPLRERFLGETKPCIVKFLSDEPRPDAVRSCPVKCVNR